MTRIYLADKPTLDNVKTKVDGIDGKVTGIDATVTGMSAKVGATGDMDGAVGGGSVFGKLNAVLNQVLVAIVPSLQGLTARVTDARAANLDRLDANISMMEKEIDAHARYTQLINAIQSSVSNASVLPIQEHLFADLVNTERSVGYTSASVLKLGKFKAPYSGQYLAVYSVRGDDGNLYCRSATGMGSTFNENDPNNVGSTLAAYYGDTNAVVTAFSIRGAVTKFRGMFYPHSSYVTYQMPVTLQKGEVAVFDLSVDTTATGDTVFCNNLKIYGKIV